MWWKGPFEVSNASLVLVVNPGWVPPKFTDEKGADYAFCEPSQLRSDCETLADRWKEKYANRWEEEGAPSLSVAIVTYGLIESWCLLMVVAPTTVSALESVEIVAALERNQVFTRLL